MKLRVLASALALSMAFTSLAVPAANAQQFRTAAPQTFSAQHLRSYGLSASDSAQIQALQAQGYQVQVIGADEANRSAGQMSTTWWIIGAVVVIAVIVAASNN